jgi:hypothetical protein
VCVDACLSWGVGRLWPGRMDSHPNTDTRAHAARMHPRALHRSVSITEIALDLVPGMMGAWACDSVGQSRLAHMPLAHTHARHLLSHPCHVLSRVVGQPTLVVPEDRGVHVARHVCMDVPGIRVVGLALQTLRGPFVVSSPALRCCGKAHSCHHCPKCALVSVFS